MPAANLVLKNTKVLPVPEGRPPARLVAISGDRILLVGDNSELESVTGPGTKIIDCQGKALAPGFNDAHCHIFSLLRMLLSVDISPQAVNSIAEIRLAILRRITTAQPGQWIIATGYNDFYLAEKRHPTRADIDDVSPNNPIILLHRSLHACVLNSRALELAGISGRTEEPAGATIHRNLDSGEPNGLLFEMTGHVTGKVLPPLSDIEANGIAVANRHFLSLGITSLQDATVTNDFRRWEQFRRLKEESRLKSRITMMFGMEYLNQFQEAGLPQGDNRLRLGGIKIVLTDAPGQVVPAQPELNEMVLAAHRAGFQVAMHAVQTESVEAAITALEYAKSKIPGPNRRHRIEHCSECPPHLLERLKKLGAVVVTQPPFIYYSGERYLATVSTDRLPWLYRTKSLMDNGLTVAGSSDSPVVPDNPLVGIYAAVTRRTETGQEVLPAEAISPAKALEMYTIRGAYASFEEGAKGSITKGKLADLVLLSEDPTSIPPECIKDIRVGMTVLGGEVVWEG